MQAIRAGALLESGEAKAKSRAKGARWQTEQNEGGEEAGLKWDAKSN